MGMGSHVGYGPKLPPGTTMAGSRKVRHRSGKRRNRTDSAGTLDPCTALRTSWPGKPKLIDTNTSRKRGARGGTIMPMRADEATGRDIVNGAGSRAGNTRPTAPYLAPTPARRIPPGVSPDAIKAISLDEARRLEYQQAYNVRLQNGLPFTRRMKLPTENRKAWR